MTEGKQPDGGSTDGADELVRELVDALADDGSRSVPAAATDATPVIKTQLTENTGRHFLDSGSHYGHAWEENRESPPWDAPAWDVHSGYVVHNVYDFMARRLSRDRSCVALEAALYAFAYSDSRENEPWLPCMQGFAEAVLSEHFTRSILRDCGVSARAVEPVLGIQAEAASDRHQTGPVDRATDPFTYNTYNGEHHSLSQTLQGTALGGPYAEYVLLQVHGGCDVRGGYTAPRVYRGPEAWHPAELHFRCDRCGWSDAESCLHGTDALLYQPTPASDGLYEAVRDRAPDDLSDADVTDACVEAVSAAEADDDIDGAVFHLDGGCCGRVSFM